MIPLGPVLFILLLALHSPDSPQHSGSIPAPLHWTFVRTMFRRQMRRTPVKQIHNVALLHWTFDQAALNLCPANRAFFEAEVRVTTFAIFTFYLSVHICDCPSQENSIFRIVK
jgi:hypothetical protein